MTVAELVSKLLDLPNQDAYVLFTMTGQDEVDGYVPTETVMTIRDFSEHEELPINGGLLETMERGDDYVILEYTD